MSSLEIQDLVALVKQIEHHKGKYIKSTLALMEKNGNLDPATRKIVLDGFNNFHRQVQRLLGYNVEG